MTTIEQWPHKWFGVWKEYGPRYQECPSIHDFVFPGLVSKYDKARLRQYLTTAQVIASTSRSGFPCPFTGQRRHGSVSSRTDGHWYWMDDLADYIDQYNVAIPAEFLREIERNGYVPPPVESDAMKRLERPPIGR